MKIPLTRGFFAEVDAEDYDRLCGYRWTANIGGKSVYARRREGNKTIYMHRQIMGAVKGEIYDHADGNGLNNRRSNLRLCTQADNLRNRGKNVGGTSRFKGVHLYKRTGKWRAQIGIEGNRVYLGDFASEEDAARAYDEAAVQQYGKFAKTNFQRRNL